MRPISRETIVERRQPLMRWSAVFAGAVLGLGLWILLQTLGVGIGLAAIDPHASDSPRAIGIGTGIWSIIAPLIAMFVGAFVAGRLDGSRSAGVGAIHGAVMWGLATAAGLWVMLSVIAALASGVARVGGAAVGMTGSVISGAASAGAGAGETLGIDTNDLLAPVNRRLAEQGKPQVTAEQLNATLRAVAQRGVREGRLDRDLLVQELARNTSLSRADAEDLATQIESRYGQTANRIGSAAGQAMETAKEAAETAADKTGKALLAGGVMMLLSLGASLGGGALGARRRDDVKPDEQKREEIRRDEIRRDEIRRDELRREELRAGEIRREEVQRDQADIVRPRGPTDR